MTLIKLIALRLLFLLPLSAWGTSVAEIVSASAAEIVAHRSGCHRWHSCPSDSGSYTCGDTGYCRFCPDNYYCLNGRPRPPSPPEPRQPRAEQQREVKPIPFLDLDQARERINQARARVWYDENSWTRAHCPGETGHTNHDGTRPDCMTDTFVIEVDFPDKWAECHGQAIRYQRVNPNLRGVCWLICGKPFRGDCREKAKALKLDAAKSGISIQCRSWKTGAELEC